MPPTVKTTPPPIKAMKNFIRRASSSEAAASSSTDAEAVRALRGSLLDVHERLAAKDEALQRLAQIHSRLLQSHSELERTVKQSQQQPKQPKQPPHFSAAPPTEEDDDEPSWVTPAAAGSSAAAVASSSSSHAAFQSPAARPAARPAAGSAAGGLFVSHADWPQDAAPFASFATWTTPSGQTPSAAEAEAADDAEVRAVAAAATAAAATVELEAAVAVAAAAAEDESGAHSHSRPGSTAGNATSRALLRANVTNSTLEQTVAQLKQQVSEAHARAERAESQLQAMSSAQQQQQQQQQQEEGEGEEHPSSPPREVSDLDALSISQFISSNESDEPQEITSPAELISPQSLARVNGAISTERDAVKHATREIEARCEARVDKAEKAAAAAAADLASVRGRLTESEARRSEESSMLSGMLEAATARAEEAEAQLASGAHDELMERLAVLSADLHGARAESADACARAASAEEAAAEARREVESLRDAEETSKRKLAAEMWAMREGHQAALERDQTALAIERGKIKQLRAELQEAKASVAPASAPAVVEAVVPAVPIDDAAHEV